MDGRRANPRIVLIGIQARTNSERFPNKVLQVADGKPVIEHVMESCATAALYLNKNFNQFQCSVRVALLVPEGDVLKKLYRRSKIVDILEFDGVPESDVLTRYYIAAKAMRADFTVRITSDCIELPSHCISSHIKSAIYGDFDYVTNTHHRTYREGWDVEVLSSNLLEWLNCYATTAEQREHVTMLLRFRDRVPRTFRYMHLFENFDSSNIKTSIDEPQDLVRFQAERDSINSKKRAALANGDFIR
jgi:spore coat polysaccharide biosynthesis protein SpsF